MLGYKQVALLKEDVAFQSSIAAPATDGIEDILIQLAQLDETDTLQVDKSITPLLDWSRSARMASMKEAPDLLSELKRFPVLLNSSVVS